MAGSSQLRAAENAYREDAVHSEKQKAPWPLYAVAVLLFCADRLSKSFALSGASFGFEDFAEFTLFMNTGIAFSIPVPAIAFWPAVAGALIALAWAFMRALRESPRGAAMIFIIIAGAASNLIDRAQFSATVDYLLFFGRSAINIADMMIVGGLLTLLIQQSEQKQ